MSAIGLEIAGVALVDVGGGLVQKWPPRRSCPRLTRLVSYGGNPVNEYLLLRARRGRGVLGLPNTAFAARELFWLDRYGSDDEEG